MENRIVTKQGTGLENATCCRPTCSNTTANPDTSTETQTAEEDQAESLNSEELLQVHYMTHLMMINTS